MSRKSFRNTAGGALAFLIVCAPFLRGPAISSICVTVASLALACAVFGSREQTWTQRATSIPWLALIAFALFVSSCLLGLVPLSWLPSLAGAQGAWRSLGWEATQLGSSATATVAADSAAQFELLARSCGVLAAAAAAWLLGTRWSQRIALLWITSAALQACLACGAALIGAQGSSRSGSMIDGAAGSFANPNQLAEWLLVGWILALGLLQSRRLKFSAGWLFATLPLLAVGLLLSRSRAGWLLAGFSLLAITLLSDGARLSAKRLLWACAPLLVAFALASGSVGASWIQTLQQDAPFGSRVAVLGQTARMALDHPWLGVGGGAYGTLFEMYRPPSVQHYWDYAHSDALQLIAEAGIPIGSAILGIALWLGVGRWRRHTTATRLERSYTYGLTLIGIYTLFEFGLRSPAITFGTAILLGASICARESRTSC